MILFEGHIDGNTVKSVIVEVSGQNYLQVDSAQFIPYFELFPRNQYQKAIYCLRRAKFSQ